MFLHGNVGKKEFNYKMIDFMKYIAAIMVICIHCNQLFPQEYLNFFIKNIICRTAVPFFFISSAYFVRKGKQSNANYVGIYLKRLMKSYCLWSYCIYSDWIRLDSSKFNFKWIFVTFCTLIWHYSYRNLLSFMVCSSNNTCSFFSR